LAVFCIRRIYPLQADRYYYCPPDCFAKELQSKTSQVGMDFMENILKVVETGIRKNEIRPLDARSITSAFYNMMIGLAMNVRFFTGEQLDEEISRCPDAFLAGIKA
jgi:hypothetical protein